MPHAPPHRYCQVLALLGEPRRDEGRAVRGAATPRPIASRSRLVVAAVLLLSRRRRRRCRRCRHSSSSDSVCVVYRLSLRLQISEHGERWLPKPPPSSVGPGGGAYTPEQLEAYEAVGRVMLHAVLDSQPVSSSWASNIVLRYMQARRCAPTICDLFHLDFCVWGGMNVPSPTSP